MVIMSTKLKIFEGNTFDVNGIEEKVLKRPEGRDGKVLVTTGGLDSRFRPRATTELTVPEFEFVSGYAFPDALESNAELTLQVFLDKVRSICRDLNIPLSENDAEHSVTASTKFTDRNGLIKGLSVFANVESNIAHIYFATRSGIQSPRRKDWSMPVEKAGPYLNSLDQVLRDFLKSRVQVLDSTLDYSSERRTDGGYDVLFNNESISQYIIESGRAAGIVRNANGDYQMFTTYSTLNGRAFEGSKAYKRESGAVNQLKKLGFDSNGLFLENHASEEVEDLIRGNFLLRDFAQCWTSGVTLLEFQADHGDVVVSKPEIGVGDMGSFIELHLKYTDEATGMTYNEIISSGNEKDKCASILATLVTGSIFEIIKKTRDESLDKESYLRQEMSPTELARYHSESMVRLRKSADHLLDRAQDFEDGIPDSWLSIISKKREMADAHEEWLKNNPSLECDNFIGK
jgi:hypothetical protein